MYLSVKTFERLIKQGQKHEALHIMNTGTQYVLYGRSWYLCIDHDALTKKAKAALIELIGEFPQEGEAFACNSDYNQLEITEKEGYWLITHLKSTEVLEETAVVLNGAVRLLKDKQDKELILLAEGIWESVSAEYCEGKEKAPEGPYLYDDYVWWTSPQMTFAFERIKLARGCAEADLIKKTGNRIVADEKARMCKEMKLSKEEQARRAGMAYALKIAKEKGVEGLEKELQIRGASSAPVFLPQKELDEFTMKVKEHTVGAVTLIAEYVLHVKFDFGNRGRNGKMGRMDKFRHWMNEYAEGIAGGWFTVEDVIENLREEGNIDLEFLRNDKSVKVRDKKC